MAGISGRGGKDRRRVPSMPIQWQLPPPPALSTSRDSAAADAADTFAAAKPTATFVQRQRHASILLPPPPPFQKAKTFSLQSQKNWGRVGGLTQKVTGGRKDATDDRDQRVQRRVTLGKLVDGRGRAAEVGAGAELFLRRAEAER